MESNNQVQPVISQDTSKLISTITDLIPAFLSPNGILVKESENQEKPNIVEVLAQSEDFFADHPNSFLTDDNKNSFVINKLRGTARKWGLSLLADGTLKDLDYSDFKELLLKNFDSGGNERKEKYVLMEKLWKLKQTQLGKVADYTIEFRRIANRIGWHDEVFMDIIGKGLLDRVREEYDKVDKPKNLFEATNIIIGIDKKCYLENCIRNKNNYSKNNKTFGRRKYELNKSENKTKHWKNKKDKIKSEILSANYTPNNKNSMTTTFTIMVKGKSIKSNFLIDSGSAKSFICRTFASNNKIPTSGLSSPINIHLPNSKSMTIRQTTTPLRLKIMDHYEDYEFLIGNLQLHGICGILGRDWLTIHNPYINFRTNKIYFLDHYCKDHCKSATGNKFVFHANNVTATMINDDNPTGADTIIPENVEEERIYDYDNVCNAMIDSEDTVAEESLLKEDVLDNATGTDNDEMMGNKDIIKKYYSNLTKVFEKEEADKLPPHRPYDITIDLIPNSQLYFGPIYSLTVVEIETLKNYIKDNLRKGFIRKSKSPAGAPVLFVKKHDGSLRLCVDYRRLNAITIRNSYPLPKINDLIESFKKAIIFTRLDLRSAYNLVRVKEGHEYLTAFRTPLGHYEYLVMPFGLRNAPSVFQRFIQDVLSEVIGSYVQVYLDDIIIYSRSLKSHIVHVRNVLKLLIENRLYVKLEKCDFHVKSTTFLGFNISCNGLNMDINKVKSILEWPTPRNTKELQSFLGLCNFYRRFIKDFAKIMEPLRKLLKNNSNFDWDNEADRSFNLLKDAFKNDELLIFPDPEKEFVVETDSSDFAVGCVLSQVSNHDNLLHPVAFYSRSLNKAEANYTIYDKELLAVITAFEVWRHHLEGAKFPIQVITDHKNLLYWKKPQRLNQRQIRWSMFLSKFDYRISFRPGASSGKPDSLSRRPDYKPEEYKPNETIIPEDNICCATRENINYLIESQRSDNYCKTILSKIQKGSEVKSSLFKLVDGVLHFQNRIIVPSTFVKKMTFSL